MRIVTWCADECLPPSIIRAGACLSNRPNGERAECVTGISLVSLRRDKEAALAEKIYLYKPLNELPPSDTMLYLVAATRPRSGPARACLPPSHLAGPLSATCEREPCIAYHL